MGARVWGRRWKVWRVVADAMQILSMLAVGVCSSSSSVKGSAGTHYYDTLTH